MEFPESLKLSQLYLYADRGVVVESWWHLLPGNWCHRFFQVGLFKDGLDYFPVVVYNKP